MKKNKYKSNMKNYKSPSGRRHLGSQMPKMALAILPLVIAANAQALKFNFGEEVSSNFDLTLSYATSWRATDADKSDLNSFFDAGGLNYTADARDPDAGDTLTNLARATAEFSMDWRNFGVLVSANYQYDQEVMKNNSAVDVVTEESVDASDAAKDYAGNTLEVLDAYAYGEFEVGENPLEVRVGKQVINWGEGLFFVNGIATQVPLNFNKFSTPGAELKEVYIGNPAIYAQMGIGEASSVEAYYQWGWNRTELPPKDTFFGSEALGRGGDDTTVLGIPARLKDNEAKDSGQFGLAYHTEIGDVEVGAYYSRYHETLPMLLADGTETFDCDYGLGNDENGDPILLGCNSIFGVSQTWAEDQDMFGFSAVSTLGDWSISSEVAYRPNQALWGDMLSLDRLYVNTQSGDDFLTNIDRHDTIHAAISGIWLGGPLDFIGVDSQVGLASIGMDHISGDRSNLSVASAITRADGLSTLAPDAESYGAVAEWIGTWNTGSTAISLDLFVQRDFQGNSHWWGNFAEDRTLFSASLTANMGADWEASLSYAGNSFEDSDYEDQDTVGLAINYKL